jgi:hypothetical protein
MGRKRKPDTELKPSSERSRKSRDAKHEFEEQLIAEALRFLSSDDPKATALRAPLHSGQGIIFNKEFFLRKWRQWRRRRC